MKIPKYFKMSGFLLLFWVKKSMVRLKLWNMYFNIFRNVILLFYIFLHNILHINFFSVVALIYSGFIWALIMLASELFLCFRQSL